jgi:type I restriction enzyme, R subunit
MPTARQIALNEKEYVEECFLRQLDRLRWTILRAGEDGKSNPAVTFRDGFSEVILEEKLRQALLKINPWLQEDQLAPMVRELTTPGVTGGLLESNRYILEKILEGSSAEDRKTRKPRPVEFIDFANPDENDFLAISQFKVNIPGTENHIIPDIALFVNGLPLGIVECKSAYLPDPIGEALEQLLRYQNRRGDSKEGNERLFWYNQFCIATSRQICKYSSITGEFEHFNEWKDPYPFRLSDIDLEGSEASPSSQHLLVQGVLTKHNFLDMVRSFIVFQDGPKGKLIKVLPRYQQYRTVLKIIERLKSSKGAAEKGGIVWHTQGSGKSLTMMMVVRRMYGDKELAGYKTVFVTDRRDLEKQLKGTAKTVGYTVNIAHSIAKLKELLRTNTPDLVMGMIHKFQEHEMVQEFPLLNTSEKILIMIDEAHRSQYKFLAANLNKSLPSAVKIAFTGTPIDKTEKAFGDYIDKYTIRQAVDDGVTVEIIYEGRTHSAGVTDREAMNKRFEDVFGAANKESRQQILGRYTWKAYLEAEETIRDKAEDMLKHYLSQIYPNGFKAQVVAVSREATIRYKKALDSLLSSEKWLTDFVGTLKSETQIVIDREQLKNLRAEVIISGSLNDPPEMKPYTDGKKHDDTIASFKLPFGRTADDGTTGDVGIIIVQSMLLTGFDAPIEQVMYLDDLIREHNLLQAIARVNRVDKNKFAGFIVDYVGVTKHLREALANFEDRDLEEIVKAVKDESRDLDELVYAKSMLVEFFKKYDIDDVNDVDACVDVLADEEARNDYLALFRQFSAAMDKTLPKPQALHFARDLKQFSFISQVARNRYRDEKLSLRDASKKVRDIVDEFLVSNGVDPKIPPVPIFSEKFKLRIEKQTSPRAKTEELKSAIGQHISRHFEEDPELYERFSDKLEKLLQDYRDNWELLARQLAALLEEIRQGRRAEEGFGLDPRTEVPFLGLLKKEIFGVRNLADLSQEQLEILVQTTKEVLESIRAEVTQVDFWNKIPAQKRLRGHIVSHLLTAFRDNAALFGKRMALGQKIMELAFHVYGPR